MWHLVGSSVLLSRMYVQIVTANYVYILSKSLTTYRPALCICIRVEIYWTGLVKQVIFKANTPSATTDNSFREQQPSIAIDVSLCCKVLLQYISADTQSSTGWQGTTEELLSLHEELSDLYSLPKIVRVVQSRRMRWAVHVARMGEGRGVHRVLVGRLEGKRPLGRPRCRWDDNIMRDLEEVGGFVGTEWKWLRIGTGGGHLWVRWWTFRFQKMRGIPWLAAESISFSRRTLLHGVRSNSYSAFGPVWAETRAQSGHWYGSGIIWYDIFINCNWVVTRWQ